MENVEYQGENNQKYNVAISNFEGPLDLLCFLISKNKMDIFEISLSELTDKYIEYINEMQELDMEIATEFMVMATTLLYIKSKKLLPIAEPEDEVECEITEEELIEKIAKYKMYKEKQQELREMYNANFGTFENTPSITSIQRATNVEITNSVLELVGVSDDEGYESIEIQETEGIGYTFNRIDCLTLSKNSTIFLIKNINMVKGYNSIAGYDANGNIIKQTVNIDANGVATTNVNNRIYVMEGINLYFADVPVPWNVAANEGEVNWGRVQGMTFFGRYAYNRTGEGGLYWYDIYDPNYTPGVTKAEENYFKAEAAIIGAHLADHNTEVDGFYTNKGDYSNPDYITVKQEYIAVTEYDNNKAYMWGELGEIDDSRGKTLIAKTYQPEKQTIVSISYGFSSGHMWI